MIKPGDKVTLFHDMRREGIVVELVRQKSSQMMIGGTMDQVTYAMVEFINETGLPYQQKVLVSKLMRLE